MFDIYLTSYDLQLKSYEKLAGYGSINYKIITQQDELLLLKVYQDSSLLSEIQAEIDFITYLDEKVDLAFTTSIPNTQGQKLSKLPDGGFVRLSQYVQGSLLETQHLNPSFLYSLGEYMGQMHAVTEGYSSTDLQAKKTSWDLKQIHSLQEYLVHIPHPGDQKKVLYFLDMFIQQVHPIEYKLPSGVIHNDLNEQNMIIEGGQLKGIIDFGDAVDSPYVYDLGIMLCYLLMLNEGNVNILKEVLKGYREYRILAESEADSLFFVIGARLATSVLHSANEKSKQTHTDYILGSETSAWRLINQWISINPVKISKLVKELMGLTPKTYAADVVESKRQKFLPSALSMTYEEPIHFRSAIFQYMFDQNGNTYLDAYNNIPIVGHNHPRISRAISNQVRTLNTNTRYHYEQLSQYAQKLNDVTPAHLTKIVFLNSGSAASDLAIRVARLHTGNHDIGVIDHGYHGNSALGIEISAYKFDGKGGPGQSSGILKLPLINSYLNKEETISTQLSTVKNRLQAYTNPLAAIIAEPISGCGGQVPLDKSYMTFLSDYCLKQHIPFIVDEVQTGFARVGHHFWAHEAYGIRTDIMVIGKPMGNAHPMAAVLMTDEIADSLNTGMEFFSSFGGNPVSCVIGNTVLDIIEDEGLQQHALEVGQFFIGSLKEIQNDFNEIGDVRGAGLFLGVELQEGGQPGTALAQYVKEYLKSKFILSSTDGPFNNVLKIKPPLCFERANVSQYCKVLKEALKSYREMP